MAYPVAAKFLPPPKEKKKNDFHSSYIINVLVYIAFNK